MSKIRRDRTAALCGDRELGYERSRTRLVPGKGLMLDEAYRRAHLPLVAPEHPAVISACACPAYAMGRHPRTLSLVLPIPAATLLGSSAYQELERDLHAACFAPKIAWSLLPRRQDKLHATLCSSLPIDDGGSFDEHQRRQLARLGPVRFELRGLFSGDVNVGRLYLRVYPEKRAGTNVLKHIQRVLRQPQTDLYPVGVFNLADHLDALEAAALEGLLRRWWDRPLMRGEADHLWLLGATDDLVLDGAIDQTVALVRARPRHT